MKQTEQDNGDFLGLKQNPRKESLKIRLIINTKNSIKEIKNHVENIIKRKKYEKDNKKKPTNCKCYNCGEEGHKSYECNKKKVRVSIIDIEDIESDLETISSFDSEISEIFEEFIESDSE